MGTANDLDEPRGVGGVSAARSPAPGLASQVSLPPLHAPNQYQNKCPLGKLQLEMGRIKQSHTRNVTNLSYEEDASSDSEDDEGRLTSHLSPDVSDGIDIHGIKSAKKVQHPVAHRVEAERSILALVVDDDYLIAGLEGGDIVVRPLSSVQYSKQLS